MLKTICMIFKWQMVASKIDCYDKKNIFIIVIPTMLFAPETIETMGINESIAITSTPLQNTPTNK